MSSESEGGGAVGNPDAGPRRGAQGSPLSHFWRLVSDVAARVRLPRERRAMAGPAAGVRLLLVRAGARSKRARAEAASSDVDAVLGGEG
jgi:hypothetical protein